MKKLRICMVAHNRPLCSIITLESLLYSLKYSGLAKEDYDIWVFDDASVAGNSLKLKNNVDRFQREAKITYIKSEINSGCMLLRNKHLLDPETPGFEFSLFIDNDILFMQEAISALFKIHRKLAKPALSVIGERSWKAYELEKTLNITTLQKQRSYLLCKCKAPGLGSALHFGYTKLLRRIGYKANECDWKWNPRAFKMGVSLYFILGNKSRRPVEHIPTLLCEQGKITKSDESNRLRSWQGHQRGRGTRCGDLKTDELVFLRGCYK